MDDRYQVIYNQNYLEKIYNRLIVIGIVFSILLLVTSVRLLSLAAYFSLPTGNQEIIQQNFSGHTIAIRSDILDRIGNVLATTVSTASLYADPKQLRDMEDVARKLRRILPARIFQTYRFIPSSKRSSVLIARHLTPKQQKEVLALKILGLKLRQDYRRVYPHGKLTSHIIGFTDVDNNGLSGIEMGLNNRVSKSRVPLILSLDLRLQHIIHDELTNGIEEFKSKGGCAVLLKIGTGEILSMVSLPDFDPHHPAQFLGENLFNKVTSGIYEMGSTMKIANTAMALESGVKITERFDTTLPIGLGYFKVTDYFTGRKWLSIPEIFLYSSNIGSAKIALEAGGENQYSFLRRIGFLDRPSLEVPEVGSPIVPEQWTASNRISVSYGYGLAISPLQMVCGIASILKGNEPVIPTLLHQIQPRLKDLEHRSVSLKTSRTTLDLMRLAVKAGTAQKSDTSGYFIFAKTGTTNLQFRRNYQKNEVMTNFTGILGHDSSTPTHVIYIMLDRPKRLKKTFGLNTAGWNAALVGRKIINRIAPILGYVKYGNKPWILDMQLNPFIMEND